MSNEPNKRKWQYAGAGIPLGAAIGFGLGIILGENQLVLAGAGVAIGLILGAIIDSQRAKKDS